MARHPFASSMMSSYSQTVVRTLKVSAKQKKKIGKKSIHSSSKTPNTATTMSIPLAAAPVKEQKIAPSTSQLRTLFIASAVPMVGFGFMDNFIMIQSAGYIDATLGAALGIATLTAAAMGQVVSDVSGVVFGGTIERILHKLKAVKTPTLTEAQRALPRCRNVAMAGSVCGIILGCLLGASSLLFVDLDAHERQQKAAELRDVVNSMLMSVDDDEILPFDECTLYLVSTDDMSEDENNQTGFGGPTIKSLQTADKDSLVARCAESKTQTADDGDGACLCAPVLSPDGKITLGVLEFVRRSSTKLFSKEDERSARMMARHLAIFMNRLSAVSADN